MFMVHCVYSIMRITFQESNLNQYYIVLNVFMVQQFKNAYYYNLNQELGITIGSWNLGLLVCFLVTNSNKLLSFTIGF